MTAPSYRPGRPSDPATVRAASVLADQVVAWLIDQQASIASWDGTWFGKGYHVFPVVSGATQPTVMIRYVPASAATFAAIYGKTRNRALDRVSREALRDAYRLLVQDGWAVQFVDAVPGTDHYTPHLLVTGKE